MNITSAIQACFATSLWVMLVGACDGDAPSALDFADGVWEDPDTGLMWQRDPPADFVSWTAATAYCDTVVLAGYDDWHLPSISELRTIIRDCPGTVTDGDCWITNECPVSDCSSDDCYACVHGDGPAEGCFSAPELLKPCEHYWSATFLPESPDRAWAVGFAGGFIYKPRIVYSFHVRCVR